jgi:hypothetical protein
MLDLVYSISHTNMSDEQKEHIKVVPRGMPEFGASGRKIVYDENGKP